MKLNEFEEQVIHEYIMFGIRPYNDNFDHVLEKAELGIRLSTSIDFSFGDQIEIGARGLNAFSLRPKQTALMIMTQDATLALDVLNAFRDGLLRSLTVRVERSWRCYIHCGDRVIEKTCEEDKASTENCCDELRKLC